ncbi:hypothetical protein [Parasitella parasitica]|uniref:DSC E3 ubiquitin ligase complex subunit 3 ubiquitin-like domain-containing protein n=1 Tax=Parasitella parasitica TaxID=35722 RepID=A0A0B7NNG6_9FUNG|nr:hypothetical protein [Parasitella parasitica]
MGCCSSIPSTDDGDAGLNTTSAAAAATNSDNRQAQTQHQQPSSIQINKPEVTITRASSSLHSQSNIEKISSKEMDNNFSVTSSNAAATATAAATTTVTATATTTTTSTWPIYVRLSNNGQDITLQVPTQPPYLTVSGLRQELLPHLEKNVRVKLIYLGRILPDQHVIVPTQTDADSPLPPPKNRAIQIQKDGVIQAMVTKPSR